jgi:hypothetical protein
VAARGARAVSQNAARRLQDSSEDTVCHRITPQK